MPAPNSLHQSIDRLFDKYEGNDGVQKRLAHHISNVLPATLESVAASMVVTAQRRRDLAEGSEAFMAGFLARNRYFYLSHPEVFVVYDGVHFVACSEDDIRHQILSEISKGGELRPWKHKVTRTLLRTLRGRSPIGSMPESPTIQGVLGRLVPAFFSSRDAAKYFLTVVGDCLRGEGADKGLVHLTPPSLRDLVRSLSVEIFAHLGSSSALQSLKFKHHDHAYPKCRVLPWKPGSTGPAPHAPLVKHSLDLLCVAHHYSTRFGSADGFLSNACHSSSLHAHAMRLANNTPSTLVDRFVDAYVQACPQRRIQMKNMIFIWKRYLADQCLPAVIFHSVLKDMLKERLSYDEQSDAFEGVTSPYVPMVAAFLRFWESAIVDDVQAQDEDLEADELRTLFRHWARDHAVPLSSADPCLLELINHFYPDVDVDQERIIVNVRCTLWDKQGAVRDAVELYLAGCKADDTPTLSAAYSAYVARPADIRSRVSKKFFERHARDILGARVDKHGVVSIGNEPA